MKRTYLPVAAGLMCQAAMWAQTQTDPLAAYRQGYLAAAAQQADSLAAGRGGRGINVVPALRPDTGKPFSAIATTQTSLTLLDGTHVSQTTALRLYRDAEGRTRVETNESGSPTSEPAESVTIHDPATGTYRLDTARKTAVKLAMAGVIVPGAGGRGSGGANPPENLRDLAATVHDATAVARKNGGNVTTEDLGTLTVNGVAARGTRITTLVPVGAIGNDKEFRSVTERWFSSELNLLVKSVSTDPRFGTTAYELTNISRQPPDPSLFQVPADYRVIGDQTAPRQTTQPAQKLIEEIDIRGAKHVSPDTLKAVIHSKTGDAYSEEGLRNDFAALWNTGRFNDVQVKTETGPRGGVVIRFIVTER